MFVLSRKKNERINLLGIDVVITVVEILGDRVRLGISAPPEVEIVRGELTRTWRHRKKQGGSPSDT
jgi:carbon storage regulator